MIKLCYDQPVAVQTILQFYWHMHLLWRGLQDQLNHINSHVSPTCKCHLCPVHCVTNAQRQCHQHRTHGSCCTYHLPTTLCCTLRVQFQGLTTPWNRHPHTLLCVGGKFLALLILSMPDPLAQTKELDFFLNKCNKPWFGLFQFVFFRDKIDHLRGILETLLIYMDLLNTTPQIINHIVKQVLG